jgi:hypothetical protein
MICGVLKKKELLTEVKWSKNTNGEACVLVAESPRQEQRGMKECHHEQ